MSGRPNLQSLKAADFGLFGATWWPFASLDRLRVVTRLSSWVRASKNLPIHKLKLIRGTISFLSGTMVSLLTGEDRRIVMLIMNTSGNRNRFGCP